MNGSDEFWDELLDFLEDEREPVLPVVGAELLSLRADAGPPIPLYRAVSERLLARYRLTAEGATEPSLPPEARPSGPPVRLRLNHELNDAVSVLAKSGHRIQDLYRPINELLKVIVTEAALDTSPLEALAGIVRFDLFVTTTSDPLLARALDTVRYGGRPETVQLEFAPNLPQDRVRDIPEHRPRGASAVFYLFGRASSTALYAIHDEDILEFVYTLQGGLVSSRSRLAAELTNRHLLVIGCNFADWLARFFLRLSSRTRLSSDRIRREFLVDHLAATDSSLTVFLERFSQNTRVCPLDARPFVAELSRRWRMRHPTPMVGPSGSSPAATDPLRSGAPAAIFLSYSGTDIAAARQLYGELQEFEEDVTWFDKSALGPGEAWRDAILAAIQRCTLFLPLISMNTESRTDGFFRREWDEAVERARQIQGRKFIIPIVIDPEFGGKASSYRLIPEKFRDFQFGHAPAGRLNDALRSEIRDQLRALRRVRSS